METMDKKGKIWLVGAGPGDFELLTIKGKRVLDQADVILYDHLVGKEVLSALDSTKEWISVGKMAGAHSVPQEAINQLLVDYAKRGKKVVRLKGGDSFLFGRGGEELDLLQKEGISFEVVPGIPSPIGVPAYSGIPVTHRDHASSLHIITGHQKQGKEDLPYEELAKLEGTLVFLMGVGRLPYIIEGLKNAGMEKEKKVALLQSGTRSNQRVVLGDLSTIVEIAKEKKVESPALILVGEVCTLAETLSWREKLPLFGAKIFLTRPRETSHPTAEKLRTLGGEVIELPTIEFQNKMGEVSWEVVLEKKYDWLVFTSRVGVRIFFDGLKERKIDIRCLKDCKVAAVGPGTKEEIEERGIFEVRIPKVYQVENLGEAILSELKEGETVLIPRAQEGNPCLGPMLEGKGARVTEIPIYETVLKSETLFSIKEEWEEARFPYLVFTSSSTVRGFVQGEAELDYSKIQAICIGDRTAETARSYGMQCEVAKEATMEALVELVIKRRLEDGEKAAKIEKEGRNS